MVLADTLYQTLYVSQLAPDCDFNVVREIVSVARVHNQRHGLTGALLFDGERFCQLLEGPEPAVRSLMQRIERDPRHVALRVLFTGTHGGGRIVQRWASGYCDSTELDRFEPGQGLDDLGSLAGFRDVMSSADTD